MKNNPIAEPRLAATVLLLRDGDPDDEGGGNKTYAEIRGLASGKDTTRIT